MKRKRKQFTEEAGHYFKVNRWLEKKSQVNVIKIMRSGKKTKNKNKNKNKKLGRILREVEAKCELDDKTKPL